jgi:hypothetical protein
MPAGGFAWKLIKKEPVSLILIEQDLIFNYN